MHNEIYESMQSAGMTTYATMKDMGHINTTLVKQISELQASITTTTMESGVKQLKAMNGKTNYKDILTLQAEFTNECISKVINFNRQVTDIITGARDEMASLFENETGNVIVKSAKPRTQRAAKKSS